MSTFLELCQRTALETGTLSGTQPAAVTGQTERLLKVVRAVERAWTDIQELHDNWRWMRTTIPAAAVTSSGTARYLPASWNITNLGRWLTEPKLISIYLTATGVADENSLRFISWSEWLQMYGKGSQTNARPVHYSISPANEFCPGQIPDASYTIKGEYQAAAVILAANGDIPGCPTQYHDIIMWRAVQLMAQHDEAAALLIGTAAAEYRTMLSNLRRNQLPQITIDSAPIGGATLA